MTINFKRTKKPGTAVPLVKGTEGFFSRSDFLDSAKRAIIVILLTRVGERVHNPFFGSRLLELVFEQDDSVLRDLAQEYVKKPIEQFEPDIKILSFDVVSGNDNSVSIIIEFVLRSNILQTGNVTLQIDKEFGRIEAF